ncbi:MAG: sel1 repeat family protein [Alteromonadaceae bacterium]|nr:sel1 repeat family protein [Alteromonadaceae bacterium]
MNIKTFKFKETVMKITLRATLLLLISSLCFQVSADTYDDAMYLLNKGEFKTAIALLTPLVNEGYAPAQYQMAMIYKNGDGVQKNLNKSFKLLTLAANTNYVDAQFDLANMYSDGIATKKDLKKAFMLTMKAAKKNLPSAQYNIGVMYYFGDGVVKDNLKASRWYKKAANQNYALAQFNLALMYYDGKGVEKSNIMSYVWNIIAARNGYQKAVRSLTIDEHNLNVADLQKARDKANIIHDKILRQEKLKAELANQKAY